MKRFHSVSLGLMGLLCILASGGCGETPRDAMWNDAMRIGAMQERYATMTDQSGYVMAQGSQMITSAIDQTLQRYPEGPEGLRQTLEAIRDGERELAEGRISGEDREALRARNQEYWAHLAQQELPPEFR